MTPEPQPINTVYSLDLKWNVKFDRSWISLHCLPFQQLKRKANAIEIPGGYLQVHLQDAILACQACWLVTRATRNDLEFILNHLAQSATGRGFWDLCKARLIESFEINTQLNLSLKFYISLWIYVKVFLIMMFSVCVLFLKN